MIADLQRDGLVDVGVMPDAVEMLAFLQKRQTYPGHVKGASVAAQPAGSSTCWAPEDVLQAPHFFEFALGFTPVVAGYLQHPRLYSVNAFTTYPLDGPPNPDIQDWHRDKDDLRFLALFVYLTDVLQESDGPHLFQVGTHQGPNVGVVRPVLGPAGTAFLADTRGIHMGVRPAVAPRTMAWARWGVSDPPASYLWDKQQPCSKAVLGDRYPSDEAVRASIRLVVQ